MSNFVLTKQHLREVLVFCFNWKKSAAEAHRMLVEVYGDNAPTDKSCREWFRRFKNGDFSVEDKPRSGQPKKFKDEELEALLDQDLCQNQEELARSLGVTQQAISVRLKVIGMIHKQGNCVPYELKPRSSTKKHMEIERKLDKYGKPNENTPAEWLESYTYYSGSKSTEPTVTVKTEDNGVDKTDKKRKRESETNEIDTTDVSIKQEVDEYHEIFIKMEDPETSPEDKKKDKKEKEKRKNCAENEDLTMMEGDISVKKEKKEKNRKKKKKKDQESESS